MKIFVLVSALGLFGFGQCLFLNQSPCDLSPDSYHSQSGIPEDADWTANITVPVSCTNGTFYWNYPRGHAILQFKNYGKTTAICLSDIVGGGMFTITDETHDKQLDQLLRAERVCTDDSEDSFVIQVDAPKFQTYVGGFAYEVKFP
ncbi:uncharacterized protein LOC128207348 isoform X2 [Mya arenaria]|uniref:uncharacterized protein LOC128207348 isoform X2 n=1 Tax=Mya arenaria TaxID=6604 RepID=UPI0022E65F60|nr:uncharacterized protein LOC128207348 isoform X2 [Mya arenaria]